MTTQTFLNLALLNTAIPLELTGEWQFCFAATFEVVFVPHWNKKNLSNIFMKIKLCHHIHSQTEIWAFKFVCVCVLVHPPQWLGHWTGMRAVLVQILAPLPDSEQNFSSQVTLNQAEQVSESNHPFSPSHFLDKFCGKWYSLNEIACLAKYHFIQSIPTSSKYYLYSITVFQPNSSFKGTV